MLDWKHWCLELLLASASAVAAQDTTTTIFSQASNDSLFWGPYRPGVYFGLRPRVPKSITTGLLWSRVEEYQSIHSTLRYTCEQHADIDGYGWDQYDPRTGGVQTIHDKGNGIDLETSFVKFDGGKGGWAARIRGQPREDAQPRMGSRGDVQQQLKTAVWFAITAEGMGRVRVEEGQDELGFEGDVVFSGQTKDLGEFKITITEPEGNAHPADGHAAAVKRPLDRTLVHSMDVPEENLWQSPGLLFSSIKPNIDNYVSEYGEKNLPPPWYVWTIQNAPGEANAQIVQKVFEGAFEFDVYFTPAGVATPTAAEVTKAIKSVTSDFEKKHGVLLKPKAPYTDDKHMVFSQSLFSNLIGGVGYFYGDQIIDRSYAEEYDEENDGFWEAAEEARGRNAQDLEGPYELFTSVPSRPFFPRGFLWDEGFHLLLMLEWDPELVMQIVSSWYKSMDKDGWIAREQIIGAEARNKVPEEFQVQYPHYANPPTLFLVLGEILDAVGTSEGRFFKNKAGAEDASHKALKDSAAVKTWLQALYPLLKKNFEWYRRTQRGDLATYGREAFSSKEAYRWRGRTPRHILTSGLDDYPRAQPPHPGELHVDLISWIGLMTDGLKRVAEYIGETDDAADYARIAEAIRRNVDDLHWSEEDKTYCDATVDAYEESILVCHKGYIGIFPFMAGLIGPQHPHLKDVLDLIGNKEELWSEHGIRSLSAKDELYGTDENYWRSPVWMNMNYLIIKELYSIATQPGPQQKQARQLYSSLRKILVDTVYNSWLETGFAWEQYNPETGAGQRTQHFTGWTSLVVKIMNMPDLSKDAAGHEEL